jgi:VanZ family protein
VRKVRAVWLAIGWAMVAAIVWLSLTPSPPKVDFEASDKLGHLLGYGTLMFWFSQLYVARKTRISYAAGFAAMGVALEFLQGQLGYRSYEVLDMYANSFGVLLGWDAALILPRVLPGAERETR